MSDKYVIEFEDEPFVQVGTGSSGLRRVKGFNSLVFDNDGLDRLTTLDDAISAISENEFNRGYDDGYEAGYQEGVTSTKSVSSINNNVPEDSRNYYLEGLHKMWEIVCRILISKENGCENSVMPELKSIFNDIDNFQIRKIFTQLDPETVVERIDEYDGIQDPLLQKPEVIINVGDQVDLGDGNLGVVFSVDEEFIRGYFYPDNALQPVPFALNKYSDIKLTGKKITGIETLINNMKKLP